MVMKEKLKFILLAIISLAIFIEGLNIGFWFMNQANTVVFYLGLFLVVSCMFGFYLVSLQQIKEIVNQFKKKN